MKKRITSFILLVFMSIVILTGCGGKQEEADKNKKGKESFPITITDAYGTEVTIDKKPERIVSLSPSTVEVLYKLNLQDNIVGVTEYCDYPKEAGSKTKVGDFNGTNIEKIVELNPDIVFGNPGMSKEDFDKLTGLGIKVIVAEARTFDKIPDTFKMVGMATDTLDEAEKLADDLTNKVNQIKDKVKDTEKVKAYYVISFGEAGNWTAGKNTFISDMINMAGGENIADDVDGWKEYSLEKIIEKDPDVMLISAMVANDNKDILNSQEGYKETAAVKNKNTVIIDDYLTQRPGPRIVDGLEAIAKALHPEVFK
jgi:iron complex transport system substrate-binding protein